MKRIGRTNFLFDGHHIYHCGNSCFDLTAGFCNAKLTVEGSNFASNTVTTKAAIVAVLDEAIAAYKQTLRELRRAKKELAELDMENAR